MSREVSPVNRQLRILCVHQGAELYGSDRSFLQAVSALRSGWPAANIRIILAADGPLRARLAEIADEVIVRDLLVLRLATPIRTIFKGTIGLSWYLAAALREMSRADLVYVNTVVIADYMLAARAARSKSVIHAREIPKKSALTVVRLLLRAGGARMIFNSQATQNALALEPGTGDVVYNGFEPIKAATPPMVPVSGFSIDRPLRIAMLGRINDWKGQDLLVAAAALLSPVERLKVRIRIIGSTFNDATAPIDALRQQIAEGSLEQVVSVEPFMDDPGEAYRWADLCAVPSRLPEPFGRVAIEAMAYGRGVLAAAHGGLVEIVEDRQSGRLLPPGDSAALAAVVQEVLAHPEAIRVWGNGALQRFGDKFTTAIVDKQLQQALSAVLPS